MLIGRAVDGRLDIRLSSIHLFRWVGYFGNTPPSRLMNASPFVVTSGGHEI